MLLIQTVHIDGAFEGLDAVTLGEKTEKAVKRLLKNRLISTTTSCLEPEIICSVSLKL